MNDRRERRYDHLEQATGEATRSGAIDVASEYYLKMRGNNDAIPTGRLAELMEAADEKGSLTATEITEILNTDELPVRAETNWSVGGE